MADATPKHVYKIVPEAPPQPIPQEFPLSELDRSDGFVHLSTATQVPLTCDRFFAAAPHLWLLKFELDKFSSPIKWEDEFPHLYGNFGQKDVVAVEKFTRQDGQTWPQTMGASSWLE